MGADRRRGATSLIDPKRAEAFATSFLAGLER